MLLRGHFFVPANLGANGITALNLAFPVFCLINGTGLMIGMGGGTRYSILKSRGDDEKADRVFNAFIRKKNRFRFVKALPKAKRVFEILSSGVPIH